MKGYVCIVEENKIVYASPNLTTIGGRSFFQHKCTDMGEYGAYKLSHFAIGDGGVDPNNPLLPIRPVETDTTLYSPIVLRDQETIKPIKQITHISPTQTFIELEVDYEDGPPQFFYNEAGLYAVNTTTNDVLLIARLTFPSVLKDRTRMQTIYWWLFF